jgi:hypothetical protein
MDVRNHNEDLKTDKKNSKYINIESAVNFYKFKLFFIQNIGIILGFSLMAIIALYGENIGSF